MRRALSSDFRLNGGRLGHGLVTWSWRGRSEGANHTHFSRKSDTTIVVTVLAATAYGTRGRCQQRRFLSLCLRWCFCLRLFRGNQFWNQRLGGDGLLLSVQRHIIAYLQSGSSLNRRWEGTVLQTTRHWYFITRKRMVLSRWELNS